MKVSRSFLSDYIDLDKITTKELAEKMVSAGNEYEAIYKLSNAEGLVVGQVIECEDHPESDHLHVCQVDIGNEIKQIICGAPNVTKNIKVIVAKVGATLPGGVIKEATLAGMKSEGMICSIEELGLESKYLTDDDKNGIHILGSDAKVGEDAIHYLGYDDEVIDFELTSNRADLMNIIGMAYEVGALYNRKVNLPTIKVKEINESVTDIYTIDVQTPNCPIYLGRLVKNIEIKESPKFIKNRLMASGIRSINNVVDISNYVMMEYGQPLHFFDADKLGNKVIVRMAENGEKIATLDGNERELTDSDIVIANESGPVALAGVMGGLDTEVTEETKNIFIESAVFDSACIRRTSHRILRSEASSRYERGIDSNRTLEAINRAASMLEEYASGEVLKGVATYDVTNNEPKKITITLDKINQILGMDLNEQDVKDVFTRLDFNYDATDGVFNVFVPTRRLDISIKEDLTEEIGRIIGYDHIKSALPIASLKRGRRTYKSEIRNKIRNRLSALGLNQVVTYSLVSDDNVNYFTSDYKEGVYVLSPLSDDKKVMRKSLISSLINVFEYNAARSIKDINIFEIGSIYYKEDFEYKEETMVSGLVFGNYETNKWKGETIKADFYLLKGIMEDLLEFLGYNGRYSFSLDTISNLHPNASCAIKIDGEIIGYMGQVHPIISKKPLFVFEISLDKLLTKKVRLVKYKELPKYPSVNKDVAFVVNKNIDSNEITKILIKEGGKLLTNVDIFDIYVGENIEENEKSIAYSLTFQDATKTLTDEEVTTLFNKMIDAVTSTVGAKIRNK